MKKKSKNLILILALVLTSICPALVQADVSGAVSYLNSQTQTAWSTMALSAAGESNITVDHLASVSGDLATDYAKTILALAAVNKNPTTFGNIDYVAKLKTYYTNSQMGSADLLNDDIWSILALASVGQLNSSEALGAKNYLLAHQNADGGFSYALGQGSDSNDTAAAIIALVEAGVDKSDSVIVSAVNYLTALQNADGGIAYAAGSDSDSGSTSWVISALNKISTDPASWNKDGNTLVSYLQSLQSSDGGFWWVAEGTSDWNNKAMTPYAVIALSGKSYPVGYYQAVSENQESGKYHLVIEGSQDTICDAQVSGTTVLDLVINGAAVCGYTYNIQETAYGLYLNKINNDTASGLSGWLFFVNDTSASVGAADYNLVAGDSVLFYFGEWGWYPTKLTASQTQISSGQSVDFLAQYFDGTSWVPLANATIMLNDVIKSANANGQLTLSFASDGVNQVYINTPGYVRSSKTQITVGNAVSSSVTTKVEVDLTDANGEVLGSAIGLEVTPNSLDFGKLKLGQIASKNITVHNSGSASIQVTASVTGDSIFSEGLLIDQQAPADYLATLSSQASQDSVVSLTVPLTYLSSGVKTGEIIFWATQ
ncbi:MAG: prenyltransferase/squalene oxidase repeat-containing protein [Candidatus Buchananbacteria bacterium]